MKTTLVSKAAGQFRRKALVFITVFTLAFTTSGSSLLLATNPDPLASQWSLTGVRHLMGLPGFKHSAIGNLWVTRKGLRFESEGHTAFLESTNILNISTGDERMLKGGTLGHVLRSGVPAGGGIAIALSNIDQAFSVIPYAAGLTASALSQGHTDFITIEFLDPHDGYHGAVFTLPWHAAEDLNKYNLSLDAPKASEIPPTACPATGNTPASLSVSPIASQGASIPDEYRILVYERLFKHLQKAVLPIPVYRSGNPNHQPDCNDWHVAMTVESFRKGDAVERAFLGPVGLFVATTGMKCRLIVTNGRGTPVLDERVKETIGGDSDSLDLSEAVAKSINRRIAKLLARTALPTHPNRSPGQPTA